MVKISKQHTYKKNKTDSPLIVFIHGAGCDKTFWALLNRYYYFKGYSTLAINLPGHGDDHNKGLPSIDTMTDYVKKIITKFNSKQKILIGHSMGSLISLNLIIKGLKDIKKLILIGTALPMNVSSFLLRLSKKNSEEAIIKMIGWSLPNDSKLRGGHLIGISLPQFIYTLMNKTSNNTLFLDLNACNKFFIEEEKLKKVNTSCLIIAGKQDVMTSFNKSYKLSTFLKNSELKKIDSCGHFHIHEKPDEIRDLISRNIEN